MNKRLITTAFVVSLGCSFLATTASPAAAAPVAVNKFCAHGNKSMYVKAACRGNDKAVVLKGVKGPKGDTGPAGDIGPAGPAGPAGESAGLVKRCATVTLNSTVQSRPASQRVVTIDGLPPYAFDAMLDNGIGAGNNDLRVYTNAFQVNTSGNGTVVVDEAGTDASPAPGFQYSDGSTERSFRYTLSGFTGSKTAELKVCAIRATF